MGREGRAGAPHVLSSEKQSFFDWSPRPAYPVVGGLGIKLEAALGPEVWGNCKPLNRIGLKRLADCGRGIHDEEDSKEVPLRHRLQD